MCFDNDDITRVKEDSEKEIQTENAMKLKSNLWDQSTVPVLVSMKLDFQKINSERQQQQRVYTFHSSTNTTTNTQLNSSHNQTRRALRSAFWSYITYPLSKSEKIRFH